MYILKRFNESDTFTLRFLTILITVISLNQLDFFFKHILCLDLTIIVILKNSTSQHLGAVLETLYLH